MGAWWSKDVDTRIASHPDHAGQSTKALDADSETQSGGSCTEAVVSTRNGGTEDFVVNERNADGLLSPAGDPIALAAAVLRLLSNETVRVRLAKAGAEDASLMTVTN